MLHNCILLLTPALKIAIASLLILAAARDIMTRIIPNWLPLALVVLCAALAAGSLAGSMLVRRRAAVK